VPDPANAAAASSPFNDLKNQARTLERILFALIGIIALLPTTVFCVLGFRDLQSDARRAAEHVTFLLEQVQAANPAHPELASLLKREMQLTRIGSLTLTGNNDQAILHLAQSAASILPIRTTAGLPVSVAPFKSISVEMNADPLLFRSGRIFAIHLVMAALLILLIHRISIPAMDRAIAQLESTQAQLIHSEKLSAIGEIYAGLTHEINNPLAIMIGKLELLLSMTDDHRMASELSRDLDVVQRNALRVAQLIRSLLVFSRKNTFQFTRTELNQVIRDVVELVEKADAHLGIRIETRFEANLPYCLASPGHLQQVFLNLLNNARDAMPAGGTITVRSYASGRFIVAEVQDTGTGMTPDVQERLFEPFFTTKGVGKGTGLGLSVAYGIIKTHGGNIAVESAAEKGSLFRVMLPVESTAP
jgi:signal transduction histidine kinase